MLKAVSPEEATKVVVAGDKVARRMSDDDDNSREGALGSLAQRKMLGGSRTARTRPPSQTPHDPVFNCSFHRTLFCLQRQTVCTNNQTYLFYIEFIYLISNLFYFICRIKVLSVMKFMYYP